MAINDQATTVVITAKAIVGKEVTPDTARTNEAMTIDHKDHGHEC